ncbi:MAG: alpha/beta fold hydrolase [Atopobiaceae bacterium]|jgi:alpha-beta hydrolase superfamily lysophospholipase
MTDLTFHDFYFPSADGTSSLHARILAPHEQMGAAAAAALERYAQHKGGAGEKNLQVKGVIQILHGMAEHIERYDLFARYLAQHGYMVVGHDCVGHGKSCAPDSWGHMDPYQGKATLIKDVSTLRHATEELIAPKTPYFLFGHSFGSFLARAYLAEEGTNLTGAIICGTGFMPTSKAAAGKMAARAVAKLKGATYKSSFLHNVADGAYAKAISGAQNGFEWLSRNEQNVADYIADDACGFMFSAGGYVVLCDLMEDVCDKNWPQKIPQNVALLYIAGAEDPVGNCGKGVQEAFELAQSSGAHDVSLKIYPHMRHEILNEHDHEVVFQDVCNWLEARS